MTHGIQFWFIEREGKTVDIVVRGLPPLISTVTGTVAAVHLDSVEIDRRDIVGTTLVPYAAVAFTEIAEKKGG